VRLGDVLVAVEKVEGGSALWECHACTARMEAWYSGRVNQICAIARAVRSHIIVIAALPLVVACLAALDLSADLEASTLSPGGSMIRVGRVPGAFKARLLTADEVYIGRATLGYPASKWANPFKIGEDGTREDVIAKYEAWLHQQPELLAALPELRGKTLLCWCKTGEACHGHVLARLVDELDRA
jgi:hypothetical protein